MIVLKTNFLVGCDIDGTLLLWNDKIKKGHKVVIFIDPFTKEHKLVRVHEPNLKVLTSHLARGNYVQAWSRSGWEWVVAAMKALNIEHTNLIISPKMYAHLDDKPCKQWMGERVFLDSDEGWK